MKGSGVEWIDDNKITSCWSYIFDIVIKWLLACLSRFSAVKLSNEMIVVLGHNFALTGPGTTWASKMSFVMDHAPGTESIAWTVDLQFNVLQRTKTNLSSFEWINKLTNELDWLVAYKWPLKAFSYKSAYKTESDTSLCPEQAVIVYSVLCHTILFCKPTMVFLSLSLSPPLSC